MKHPNSVVSRYAMGRDCGIQTNPDHGITALQNSRELMEGMGGKLLLYPRG